MRHPYQGVDATLITKHGKSAQIAPAFARLGITVNPVELDTDQFGTFSPEVPRRYSQRETALAKAKLGISEFDLDFAIASEASVGSDPVAPFLNSIIECLVWVDRLRDLEVVQFHRSFEVVAIREELTRMTPLEPILRKGDFPNHALIIYAEGGQIFKGIRSEDELFSALEESFAASSDGSIILESDLRAHMSPSRQIVIRECAELIVARLERLCTRCGLPGFGVVSNLTGLPCEICGNEVSAAVRGELLGCASCEYREEQLFDREQASAASCSRCNP